MLSFDQGSAAASATNNSVPVSGTYTVVLQDDSADTIGNYDIHFARIPDANEGGVLFDGDTVANTLTIGDTDSYTFSAAAGALFTVTVADTSSTSFFPELYIYDPAGALLAFDQDSTTASVVNVQANLTGTYTAIVQDDSADTPGDYVISYVGPPSIALLCDGHAITVNFNIPGEAPTTGADVILGTPGPDIINALGGDDIICGEGGGDTIYGTAGHDRIFGGPGTDILFGGTGNDYIDGGPDADDILGQGGSDDLFGGGGYDYIVGGSGGENIETGSGGAYVVAGGNNDVIDGSPDSNVIYANAGLDTVRSFGGQDYVFGGQGADYLFGGPDDDCLSGQGAKDNIYGEGGNDTLFGGLGNDLLYGGANTDACNGQGGTDTEVSCESAASGSCSAPVFAPVDEVVLPEHLKIPAERLLTEPEIQRLDRCNGTVQQCLGR